MAKKPLSTAPALSESNKKIADQFKIPTGPDRFNFLDRFPLVRQGLDTYVTICAIREKITDTSDDLLPEQEVINLPHNDAFLRAYFGKARFSNFRSLVNAADRVSRRVATLSAAAAIRGGQIIQEGSLSGDSKARERLLSAYQSLIVILFNLILFINRRGELSLKAERKRIKEEYVHQPIFKDILGLLISFDSRSHALVTMLNGNEHGAFTDLITDLGRQAQQVHAKILEACVALEISLYNDLAGNSQSSDGFNQRVISIAFETQRLLDQQKQPDPAIPLEAASEVIEYLSPSITTSKVRVTLGEEQHESPNDQSSDTKAGDLAQEYQYEEAQRRKL